MEMLLPAGEPAPFVVSIVRFAFSVVVPVKLTTPALVLTVPELAPTMMEDPITVNPVSAVEFPILLLSVTVPPVPPFKDKVFAPLVNPIEMFEPAGLLPWVVSKEAAPAMVTVPTDMAVPLV